MKRLKLHISPTWRRLLFLMLLQLACALLLVSTWQFHQHHANATQTLQQQLLNLQTQQETWHQQQALVRNYLPQYQKLVQTRQISPARPKLWLQQLKQIQQSQQLFPAQYSLLAQQPYQPAIPGLQLMVNTMKFEMDLLHEEDLLNLLDTLKASHVGSFVLHHCKLHALQSEPEVLQLKPRLRAKCELDWFAMPLIAKTQISP